MRISDWSSDVCSSDLPATSAGATALRAARTRLRGLKYAYAPASGGAVERAAPQALRTCVRNSFPWAFRSLACCARLPEACCISSAAVLVWPMALWTPVIRSEEHTAELQALMRNPYAV